MFTYYLCTDNETIYRIEFSIRPEDKERYLSLLENYLTEIVFREESKETKLVKKEEVEKENREKISIENYQISLEKMVVTSAEKIEDNLPYIVKVKTKKYSFLRTYTICLLINLLSNDLDKIDSPYIAKIAKKLLTAFFHFDFSSMLKFFSDESGSISPERFNDYNSSMNLLRTLKVSITGEYSRSYLSSFWQGDEADREVAAGIVSHSGANKEALKRLNFEPLKNRADDK